MDGTALEPDEQKQDVNVMDVGREGQRYKIIEPGLARILWSVYSCMNKVGLYYEGLSITFASERITE